MSARGGKTVGVVYTVSTMVSILAWAIFGDADYLLLAIFLTLAFGTIVVDVHLQRITSLLERR